MSPHYIQSPENSHLRQCEILCGIVEYRPVIAAAEYKGDDPPLLDPRKYPYLVVITNECDLLYDYQERSEISPEEKKASPDWERNHHKILPHVLMCEAFTKGEIKALHELNSKLLGRIEQNQNERLHYLPQSKELEVPDLYLDFKKHFTVATQSIYDALEAGAIIRRAVLDGSRRYDLMHRFYSCLSRVGVEDQ